MSAAATTEAGDLMAIAGDQEVELLKKGLEQDGVARDGWCQNMWVAKGSFAVRPGWGQVAELDTTFGLNTEVAALGYKFGYEKHLGSSCVKTKFGHDQILSVFVGKAGSGELAGESRESRWNTYYFVRIYDITTNRHWEEVLSRQTADNVQDRPISSTSLRVLGASFPSEWHGSYETTYDLDNSKFLSGKDSGEFFFHVFGDQVYFGASGAGLFVYRPADFLGLRRQQLQTADQLDWHNGLSESSLILRLSFAPGIHEDALVYIEESQLSAPTAAATFRGRLAVATGREIFFSDPGRPQNIIGINFIVLPSALPITAMHELRGNLIIFTAREMFFYTPSEGTIISKGRPPVRISESVGCVGPQSLCMMNDKLAWVGHDGIYTTADGVSQDEISKPIRSFWGDFGLMTNPVTSFFQTALANPGFADPTGKTQPRTLIEFDREQVTIAYNHLRRTLLVSIPDVNGIWAFSGIWSFWPLESVANQNAATGLAEVNTTRNLKSPWVMSTKDDFYLVSGVDRDRVGDAGLTYINGVPNSYPAESGNYVLSRLGRGGGLDRSSEDEDFRLASGKYVASLKGIVNPKSGDVALPPVATSAVLYFRPPVYEEETNTNWIPVELVPPEKEPLPSVLAWGATVRYELFFQFDNTHWDPGANAVTAAITLRLPAERLGTGASFTIARVTNAARVPDPNGNHIEILWDGAAAGPAWSFKPNLNINKRTPNPLFSFAMTPKQTLLSVAGFGIGPVINSMVVQNATGSRHLDVPTMVFIKHFIGTNDDHNLDKKVQAVDWAYMGKEVSTGGMQIRARGLNAYVQSRGRAASRIVPGWLWGLYNVLLGSDAKEFSSQLIDYADDISTIRDKTTIRSRFRSSTSTAMTTRTFAGTPRWGSVTSAAAGDYLIDDEETDRIVTSDSVKGGSISYMVFGFVRNRAEAFTLRSLAGIFRRAGGRRRTGR